MKHLSNKSDVGPSLDANPPALERLAALEREFASASQVFGPADQVKHALELSTAVDNIPQGICFFGPDERLILSNRRYAEIYRLDPVNVRPGLLLSQVVEMRRAAETCDTAVEDYLAMCSRINSGLAPKTWTAQLSDGRLIQINHQALPNGGWVATHEDITELQSHRAGLSDPISLQTLIDWVPDYLWIKDAQSHFLVCNKALATDTGKLRTSDMIGLDDFELHPPERAAKFRAVEAEIMRSGTPMVDIEEFVTTGEG